MTTTTVSINEVKLQIADIFEQQLGLPKDRILAGEAFIDLDPHFDSLSLVQAQLFLEELYEARFERTEGTRLERLPANIDELVELIYPRLLDIITARQSSAT